MNPEIRALRADDAAALQQFLVAMPPRDRSFFFWDVDDPAVAEAVVGDERRTTFGAFLDSRLIAFSALNPGVDWSSHVADLSLAVAPDHRQRGLGKALARAMLLEGLKAGYRKVTVSIAADNEGAIDMFRKLGFEGEALLRDQLLSPEDGSLHDVVLLAHLVDETWSGMVSTGFEEALG